MVWRAQELYCVERLSFAKVAELTGVSATTLKAWGQKFKWAEKREELAYIESEIRMDTIRSRKKALEMLLESGNGKECSQMAFAVSSLENLALKQQEIKNISTQNENDEKARLQALDPNGLNLGNKDEVMERLGNAIQHRLAYALQNPQEINSKTVDDIVKMLNTFGGLKDGVLGHEKVATQTNLLVKAL